MEKDIAGVLHIMLARMRNRNRIHSWEKLCRCRPGCNRASFDHDSVMDEYASETLFRMQNAATKNSAREK